MQQTKTLILSGVALLFITLLPRVFSLNTFETVDERRWLANVTAFVTHLAHYQWDDLVEQPHPGITTQWLAAPTVFTSDWATRKLPLVVSQSLFVLIIGYCTWQLWGKRAGALATLLLALNPLLVAHTRVYAMDSLLALFLLLSLCFLLLWKKTSRTHYLALAAAAGAAAVLSKLSGILIIPFSLLFIWWHLGSNKQYRQLGIATAIWLLSVVIAACLLLPSLVLNPWNMYQEFLSFFESGDYQEIHQGSRWYYLLTLFFFTTPLQLVALVFLPIVAWRRATHQALKPSRIAVIDVLWLSLFGLLFLVQMSLGLKKGDRYVLPLFLIADLLVVAVLTWSSELYKKRRTLFHAVVIGAVAWQALILLNLHPHYLSFVNPLTKPWIGERPMGWGEGLDVVANYLNNKPDAHALKVASYYSTLLTYSFKGTVVPAHEYDHEGIDYVVLYRSMYGRGADAWETDVLAQHENKEPEKIIRINGLDYAWIYRVDK